MEELFIFVGKAATGKDTALNHFVGPEYNILVSDTTRPKRPTEKDGIDYNFISNRTFLKRVKEGNYLEYTKYNVGHEVWYYGTGKHAIKEGKINLGVLNPDGIYQVAKTEFKKNLFVVIFKVSDEVRKKRYMDRELKARNEDLVALEARFIKRSIKDDDDFSNLEEKLDREHIKYTTVLNNCSFEDICKKTEEIVKKEYLNK